jgi:O-antigen ligase
MSTIAYGALWIFVFSIPWERIIVMPGVSVMPKVTGALALALAALAAVVDGRFRGLRPFHIAVLLFVVWTACVLLFIGSGPVLPNKFWTWPQLLLVVWMIWELAPSVTRVRGLFLAFVLGAYVAVMDTVLLYRRQAGALRRFAAGGADPNDLAMMLALAIPMAWYLGMVYHRPLLRWLCRAYLPIGVVAIGLTGSRGGMIATTVALLVVPFLMTKLSPGRLVTATLMLGIAGALAVAYTPDTLIQRLATTGTELEQGRIGGRGRLWRAGIIAFARQPVMGYGTGSFRVAITPILGSHIQAAHNSFISVLVEQGLVGFVLYMTMLGAVFLAVRRLRLLERRFGTVLFITLMVAMLPLTWEDRRAAWFIFSALVGLAHADLGILRRGVTSDAEETPRGRPRVPPPLEPVGPGGYRAGTARA